MNLYLWRAESIHFNNLSHWLTPLRLQALIHLQAYYSWPCDGVVRVLVTLCFMPANPICIMIRLTTTWRSSRALHTSTLRPGLSGASQWGPRFLSHGQELHSEPKDDSQLSQGESTPGQKCRLFGLLVLGVRFRIQFGCNFASHLALLGYNVSCRI